MANVSNGSYVNAVRQEQLNAEFQQTVDMAKIWSDWHGNAQDTMNQLFETIKSKIGKYSIVYQLHTMEIISEQVGGRRDILS